ncbi:MAG: hypothetical protein AAF727_01230 [Pseudomonadota bacterium]
MADTVAPTLPQWYAELPPAARSEDFHQQIGRAEVFLCERSMHQLVISFGHAEDTDHPELDWPAWTDRLARGQEWSHLALLAPKGTWFRDPALIQTLEQLRDLGFFSRFDRVTLFGAVAQGGGFAALAFAPLIPGAVVVAFDAQSTLRASSVPWEDRFAPQTPADWTRPYSDTSRALTRTERAYVAYDPFERRDAQHVARLPAKRITALRAPGLQDDIGIALKRLGLLDDILIAAVAGTLTPQDWNRAVRQRRDLYLYRRGMERHLTARGKDALSDGFVQAFRQRNRARKAQAAATPGQTPPPAAKPAPQAPNLPADFPDAPTPPALAGRRWPRTRGNVWGLQDLPTGYRYLSDQYEGRVMGFEERREVTLAETPPLSLGMAAFGHRAGLPRALPEDFRFHVVDTDLSGQIAPTQAKSHGVSAQHLAALSRHAYRTVVALDAAQPGITADEAAAGSPLYTGLIDDIGKARGAMQGWNKGFHLDRIALALLGGAPNTPLQDAITHYGTVAHALRFDAARAAGQASFPLIVVSQSAGTRTDGTSEVILAEGQLDIAHPALGVIVATPTYPFTLMDGMPATLCATSNALVDELESLAIATVQDGVRWYCPSMRSATGAGRTITVDFASLSPLVLDEGPHGFALLGEGAPAITSVTVSGTEAVITLDTDLPDGPLSLSYAWGATAPHAANRTANTGALRDSWSRPSVMAPGTALYRHALSGRVAVTRGGKP